jgi:hypothetical protein
MPRARTTTTEELLPDAPKKRAPRKRVTPVDGEVVTPRPRAPRRKVVVEEETVVETPRVVDVPTGRRAPTPLRAERTASSRSRRSLIIAAVFFFVFTGIGVGIGMSDSGQIDVVAVVNERNERVNRGEVRTGESTISVPVQNGDIRPNGGLVPADPSTLPPPVPEAATTTDATASSTDEGTATSSETTAAEAAADTEVDPAPESST